MNRAGMLGVVLSLSIALPSLSFFRFYPLPDWVSSIAAMALVCVAILMAVLHRIEGRLSMAAMAVLVLGLYGLIRPEMDGLSFSLVLLLIFVLLLYLPRYAEMDLPALVTALASGLLAIALLQCVLGWIQLLGLAPKMHGLVLFDKDNSIMSVFGNIGQRNLYADFLMWGVLAACYLFAVEKLNKILLAMVLLIFALMVTWSSSRLPLAYGLGLALSGWFWLRKSAENVVVRRMVAALAGFVLVSVLVQIFSHSLIQALHYIGLNVEAQSGSERLMGAGFGARRRIEWTKAWDIFLAHPWFGVGFGGFPAISTRMEVYAGLPKMPESWLFTHSHNIVFQLLAETGLLGTITAAIGILVPASRFLKSRAQTVENLFLFGVMVVILIHSLFEYPLWYVPYLLMFCVACALAPGKTYPLPIRSRMLAAVSAATITICACYIAFGLVVFSTLIRYSVPASSPQARTLALQELSSVANYPLWSWDVDMALANYIEPSKAQLAIKLQLFERLASYRPQPGVLLKLSVLQALNQQPKQAEATMRIAIANYPDYVARFVLMLAAHPEPEVVPLRSKALIAAETYGRFVSNLDQARLATVMTAAEPVGRKPLF